MRRLNLQYRDRLEFAVGRTCSVDWQLADGARRATKVWTTWLPTCETPQVTAEEIDALLDMRKLAAASPTELRDGLGPIVERYEEWLDGEEAKAQQLPAHLQEEGLEAVSEARKVHRQLADGLVHLLTDPEALRCFRFMNEVMADQRVQSQVARRRAQDPDESLEEARAAVLAQQRSPHSWFTFQLAFILMQLPLLTDPAAAKRSGDLATAQLLFFPTGGGKTEAYLGLAAYAFAIRRRQAVVDTPDGQLDGRDGVTVLMRYTLRLLTSQQFQRATALVCAAEVARRRDEDTWGKEPFRIGLWVGTDVSPKRFEEAETQLKKASTGGGYRLTVLQVQRCPWCGSKIDVRDLHADPRNRRIYVYCGDELAELPVLPGRRRRGRAADPHGRRGDLPARPGVRHRHRRQVRPARPRGRGGVAVRLRVAPVRAARLRAPRLPALRHQGRQQAPGQGRAARRRRPPGHPAPPAGPDHPGRAAPDHRRARHHGRPVRGRDRRAHLLAHRRRPAGPAAARRLHRDRAERARAGPRALRAVGDDLPAAGPRRRADVLLPRGAGHREASRPAVHRHLHQRHPAHHRRDPDQRGAAGGRAAAARPVRRHRAAGSDADPYLTLVGYFSATRELAGMARYLGDDIQTALAKGRPWSRLPRRFGTDYGALHVAELTSRVASADITGTLDQMAVPFDPVFDSTAGKRALTALRQAGKPVARPRRRPLRRGPRHLDAPGRRRRHPARA